MATRRSSAAPQRPPRTAPYAVVRDANAREDRFNFGRVLGTALISLLTALIGTGLAQCAHYNSIMPCHSWLFGP
jgi:hypothetical protein